MNEHDLVINVRHVEMDRRKCKVVVTVVHLCMVIIIAVSVSIFFIRTYQLIPPLISDMRQGLTEMREHVSNIDNSISEINK